MSATPSPLADYERRVTVLAQRAQSVRERVAQIRPSVTSSDGAVTVTVSAAGALDDIAFGSAAGDHSLDDLAGLIKRTAQSARVRAARQTQAALAELVGESGPAMDFLRSQLPALREEDPAAAAAAAPGDGGRRDAPQAAAGPAPLPARPAPQPARPASQPARPASPPARPSRDTTDDDFDDDADGGGYLGRRA